MLLGRLKKISIVALSTSFGLYSYVCTVGSKTVQMFCIKNYKYGCIFKYTLFFILLNIMPNYKEQKLIQISSQKNKKWKKQKIRYLNTFALFAGFVENHLSFSI